MSDKQAVQDSEFQTILREILKGGGADYKNAPRVTLHQAIVDRSDDTVMLDFSLKHRTGEHVRSVVQLGSVGFVTVLSCSSFNFLLDADQEHKVIGSISLIMGSSTLDELVLYGIRHIAIHVVDAMSEEKYGTPSSAEDSQE